jgi:nitrite reductase/ring-hydroxylating ferredoxin subunit
MSTPKEIKGVNLGFGPENPNYDTPLEHAFRIAQNAAQPPKARRGEEIIVCSASEIPEGGKRIVDAGTFSIGVFNIKGKFYAVKNVCPHAGAPLCEGHIQTTHRPSEVGEFIPALEGRVLRCPWHGFEFDIITGKGLYDRTSRVTTYAVEVDDEGNIIVKM